MDKSDKVVVKTYSWSSVYGDSGDFPHWWANTDWSVQSKSNVHCSISPSTN